LGTALSNGETPSIAEAYDPKSLEHILAGTYPVEKIWWWRWMFEYFKNITSLF
jgi:hypothetical protein